MVKGLKATGLSIILIFSLIIMSSSSRPLQGASVSGMVPSELQAESSKEEDAKINFEEELLEAKRKKFSEAALKNRENQNVDFLQDNRKVAYLTFDDTMSQNTVKILDTLLQYNIKGTFFPNLEEDNRNEVFEKQMLKRMSEEGHEIGNHTASHKYSYIYASINNYLADTEKLNTFVYEAAGVRPTLIRFPGGSNNPSSSRLGGRGFMRKLMAKLKEQGYEYFDWNVTASDSAADTIPKDIVVKNILTGTKGKNKAIILMHQSKLKTTTAEALPEVIEGLKAMGYSFETLSKETFTVQFVK